MTENLNTISCYDKAVTKGQKKRLLAAYSEYISLVRTMEGFVAKHTSAGLAAQQTKILYPDFRPVPWNLDDANNEETKAYADFLKDRQIGNEKYCFISFNLSADQNTKEGILSVPKTYLAYSHCNTLPHRAERFVAAFPQKASLKNTTFIVDGKYCITLNDSPNDMTIKEAFEDELMVKRFQCILEILGKMSGKLQDVEDQKLRQIQNETLASELTAPFENVILSALSALTEEANRTLKEMLCRKKGDNYLYQAENGGIIPSASRFQEYQNIRHLMHHQWDTLDNLGHFTFYDTDRNASVRARYLDGYGKLCNKPLSERIKSYTAVATDFAPLIEGLSPELLIRKKEESHSKFIARLKAYKQANPEKEMLIETGYAETHTKKQSLIKSIEKLFPNAEIIDRQDTDMNNFLERIMQYTARRKFLDMFADLEYKMCQYCFFSGRNQPVIKCWQDMIRNKFITPDKKEQWNEYRKLRNELSHHHLSPELAEKLKENLIQFAYDMVDLSNKILSVMPKLYLVKGNIYRAVQKNGKIVELDFKEKRVLNIITPSGKTANKQISSAEPRRREKRYDEEHDNKVSITLNGTEITGFRMQDKTTINLHSQKITLSNLDTFFFNSAEHNSLVCKGNIKLIIDKNFRILNYINNGKSVEVSKNEVIWLKNKSKITIGPEKNIETISWQDDQGKEHKITYNGKETIPYIRFDDGTSVRFKPTGAVITHNGIELTYQTRKAFADSYQNLPPSLISKKSKTR